MSLDITWFNIPVLDINRAVKFYSWLFDIDIPLIVKNKVKYAYIINSKGHKIGLLFEDRAFIPDKFGIILHFFISKKKLWKIKKNIILEKDEIYNTIKPPKFCTCIIIEDSEGNRISLCHHDCK